MARVCHEVKVFRMVSIGAASRLTGIPAATLRKWETRYGFPVPIRGAGGHRQFRAQDLDALAHIARCIAEGQRAGHAIAGVLGGVQEDVKAACAPRTLDTQIAHALDLALQGDISHFEAFGERTLSEKGIRSFASDFVIPLMEAVGSLWQGGKLPVYAEHFFSSSLQTVISRHVPAGEPAQRSSDLRVLLASPPQEAHTLALTLLHALLCQARIPTVFLMGGLPAAEIAAAARAYRIDVIALSASLASSPKSLQSEYLQLRALLPATVTVWIGGAGSLRIRAPLPGITMLTSIDEAVEKLKAASVCQSAARRTVRDSHP
jgi:hypothetical protein